MKTRGIYNLDRLTGGLAASGSYLIAGSRNSGKSALAYSYLAAGLAAGESGALITTLEPESALGEAKALGLDLTPYVERGALLIFEYPEGIEEAVADLNDIRRIVDEFGELVGSQRVDRLVFDTIEPLSSSQGVVCPLKFRAIVESFAAFPCCKLYLVNGEGRDLLAGCDDVISGLVMLSRQVGSNTQPAMSIDGFRHTIEPEYSSLSLTVLEPEEERRPAPARRGPMTAGPFRSAVQEDQNAVLILESDTSRRLMLRLQLERTFTVAATPDLSAGMAVARKVNPPVILVGLDLAGARITEMVGTLRAEGCGALIVGLHSEPVAGPLAVDLLAAGIDLFLPYSADDRVTRLTILNFLNRMGMIRSRERTAEVKRMARDRVEEGPVCTRDVRSFIGRVAREVIYSRENGLYFVVMTLQTPGSPELSPALADVAAEMSRLQNGVYCGPSGAAWLLEEASSGDQALAKFRSAWRGTIPVVEEIVFTGQEGFLKEVREFVVRRTGISEPRLEPARGPMTLTRPLALPVGDRKGSRRAVRNP